VRTTRKAATSATNPSGEARGTGAGLAEGEASLEPPSPFAMAITVPRMAITATLATIARIVVFELGPGPAGSSTGAEGGVGCSGGGGTEAIGRRCITMRRSAHRLDGRRSVVLLGAREDVA
jgi:hypothetical protein